MKSNKNGVKLLATIMVFAMAFAGIAVVASDDSNAALAESKISFYNVSFPAYNATSETWDTTKTVTGEDVGNEIVSTYSLIGGANTYYLTGDLSRIAYGPIEISDWNSATAQQKAQYVLYTGLNGAPEQHYILPLKISGLTSGTTQIILNKGETGEKTIKASAETEEVCKYISNSQGSFTICVGGTDYVIAYNFNLADSFLGEAHKTGNALDNGATSGTGWSLNGKTLTLEGYNGSQYFLGDFNNVVVKGTNVIKADNSNAAFQGSWFGAIASVVDFKISGQTGASTDSLTITQNNPEGYGISSFGKNVVSDSTYLGNITVEKCTITVNDGCNRAFYGNTITIGDGSSDVNVKVTASEKAIRASSLDVKAKAIVEALLSENINTNGKGIDNVYGIKVDKGISNAGLIKSQGFCVKSITTNTGKIYVSGDYAQKPGYVAGYELTDSTGTATRITQISESDAAGIYILGDAMASSNVTVSSVGGTSETVSTKTTAGIQAKINESPVAVLVLDSNYSDTTTPITLAENKTLVIQTGNNTYTGEVKLGNNNKVNLDGVKGTFTISYGSVYIGGQFNAGTMTVYGDAHLENNTTIANGVTLVIDSGATLKLEGFVLTNNGIIKNAGTIESDGSLVNNGIIDFVGDMGLKDTINTDTTITANAYLSGDLTIPEGVTLTIKSNAKLDMVNYNLIVKGTLVVENKGIITSSADATNSIVLSTKGVIDNKGVIGDVKTVTISCINGETAGIGTVTVKGLSGVELGTVKVGTSYYLTVAGTVSAINKDPTTFEIDGAYISGDLSVKDVTLNLKNAVVLSKDSTLTIGSKAKLTMASGASLAVKNATVIVDGSIAGNVSLTAGSSVVINGYSYTTYAAATGYFKTFNTSTQKRQTAEDVIGTAEGANVSNSSITTDGKITGYTISVTTKAYTATDGVTPMTRQMLNIAGDAKYNYTIGADGKPTTTKEISGTITMAGTIYIQSGETLNLLDGMTIAGTTYTIITDGTLVVPEQDNVKYKGALYAIDVSAQDLEYDTVYYYTTFDNAYAVIDTVVDKTITIAGDYTFSKTYTIKADQVVQMASGSVITIGKAATVTVESDGELSGTFSKIKGVLTVMYGGDCVPAESSYEVKAVDSDKNTTYSSAEVAIKNAEAGSTIYIVNAVSFEDPATIPAGVTINVSDTASITAQKGLTVNGKIVNEGTIRVNDGYDLVVPGEIESTGTITLGAGAGSVGTEMTVTGIITSVSAITIASPDKVNAACFTNEDGEYVFTSVANAVDITSKMDTPAAITLKGKFTERSDLTLTDGMAITIDSNAEIILSSIRLNAGSTLTVTGTLTADVIASVGKADTTGAVSDAVIGMDKVKDASVNVTYTESTTTYTMTMKLGSSYIGNVVLKSGNVTLASDNDNLTFTDGNTLTIDEGATLVINKTGIIFTDDFAKNYLKIKGTVVAKDNMTLTNATIAGTVEVDVEKKLTLATEAKILGNIVLSEKTDKVPAQLIIDGTVWIGATPETLGEAVSISGDIDFTSGYVVVFDGNTFDDVTDVDSLKITKYVINGTDFATIYTEASNLGITTLDTTITGLDDLAVTTIEWYADGVKIETPASTYVGQYEVITSTITYSGTDVLVSAGPGLIVYINDFKVIDNRDYLMIGTHTVTIYLEPGYEGTPVITFNGQKVTDGKITITTDMVGVDQILVVTGATPAVTPTPEPMPVPTPSEKDDSMGITEYLLIVLVILAAILVVVVAIRMMRS